jgi:hypothetical protein
LNKYRQIHNDISFILGTLLIRDYLLSAHVSIQIQTSIAQKSKYENNFLVIAFLNLTIQSLKLAIKSRNFVKLAHQHHSYLTQYDWEDPKLHL